MFGRTLQGPAPLSSNSSIHRRSAYTQHPRPVVLCRYNVRSASPRSSGSESWRSSWRTELDDNNSAQDNGNGYHAYEDNHYSNGNGNGNGYSNGYESNGGGAWGSFDWADRAHDDEPHTAYDWRDEQHQQEYQQDWRGGNLHGADEEEEQQEEEVSSSQGEGFFTDAFRNALKDALSRSPLYSTDSPYGAGSGDEEDVPPQPSEEPRAKGVDSPLFSDQFRAVLRESLARRQAELDRYSGAAGSDDEDPAPVATVATPYVPAPPPQREMSPLEEVLATALGSSQLNLRRLTLMAKEIEQAMEREAKQIERLEFAMKKAQGDVAYYQTLQKMVDDMQRRR